MEHLNQVKLSGSIVKFYSPIDTPAGVKVARFLLEHSSMQVEAGIRRNVKCRIFCVYVAGEIGEEMLNYLVNVCGFLSVNSQKELVLHITNIQKMD